MSKKIYILKTADKQWFIDYGRGWVLFKKIGIVKPWKWHN